MGVVGEYLIQNWGLILVLIAFVIALRITVFLEKKTIIRLYCLIGAVFVLSIIVFVEFYFSSQNTQHTVRTVMMAIRYSATPIIIALILFALVKRMRWYVLIPSFVLTLINFISIPTGIVFSLDSAGELHRGVLGYLPYIGVGVYSVLLVYTLVKQSNKQASEIIPIVFMILAIGSGLVLPFILGKDYHKIFCTTLAVALFVYYVFLILQLTKKDALTGLLNRQAYYSVTKGNCKEITGVVSIDMNGLKAINDIGGHNAGDEALINLANCFTKAAKNKQSVYRIGGDEFVILCRKTSEEELKQLVENVRRNVSETDFACSIGYCYSSDENKDIDEMIKESDEMMYTDKANYYSQNKNNRRMA